MTSPTSAAVVVPVKAFDRAKVRLAARSTRGARRPGPPHGRDRCWPPPTRCRRSSCATTTRCGPGPQRPVPGWCGARGGAQRRRGRRRGRAGGRGRRRGGRRPRRPAPRDPTRLGGGLPRASTLVPDRRLDGTNVLAVPTEAGFRFAYGAGSFGRHRAEAQRARPARPHRPRRPPGLGRRPARRPRLADGRPRCGPEPARPPGAAPKERRQVPDGRDAWA